MSPLRQIHLLIFGSAVAGLTLWSSTDAQYLSFDEIASISRSEKFILSDIDGDGCDEVLIPQANHVYLYVWDGDHLKLKSQLPQNRSWNLLGVQVADVVGDRKLEINVLLSTPESLRVQIYRMPADCFPSLAAEGCSPVRADSITVSRSKVGGRLSNLGPYLWDVGAMVLGRLSDPPGAGPAILAFSTGYSMEPRGLAAFDADSPHDLLWQYKIGPVVKYPVPVFRHSNPESTCILLRGAYAGQDYCASGLCDSLSAVVAVNANGKVLWSRRVGGKGTEPYALLADLDADGVEEVVTACSLSGKTTGSPSQLMVLSLFEGRVLKRLTVGTSAVGLTKADVNADTKPELILLGADGRIDLYDSDLNRVETTQGASEPWKVAIGDVDYDGYPEIFVSAKAGRAVDVFNASLRRIGRIQTECSPPSTLEIMSLSKNKRALALGANGALVLYRASLVKEPPWVHGVRASGASPSALWLAAALAGGMLLGGLAWRGSSILTHVRPAGSAKALVGELGIVRHGARTHGKSEEPLVRLRRGLRTCTDPRSVKLGCRILKESSDAYRTYVAPALRRIVRLSALAAPISLTLPLALAALRADKRLQRALALLPEAGGTDHEGGSDGSPARSDRGLAESLGDKGGDRNESSVGREAPFTSACAAAARSFDRLEALLNRLDRAALSRLQADPYVETSLAVETLQEHFDRRGIVFGGIHLSGLVGARVFIEPPVLRRTMYDILSNAIEACEDTCNPTVSVHVVGGERKVILQVIDNGAGLPREHWEAVFHGKSLKQPKGGTGLSRARQAVEACSGRIFIRESVPWERTVIEIELCRVVS